ncbi:MAG: hypothetical protein ACK5DE_03845 [Bacteroidota bacterium]|jgi:hypothetical protein
MANYTLSYSDMVDGWVSFYSYYPDWMIGMNNYFYTFKGGDLYRHNVNESRNTFYTPWFIKIGNPAGAFTPATLQSVFNASPLENKLFKTINLEGDAKWDVTLQTDLQFSGFIEANWFEKKEAAFFAFVRNNSIGELALRSVNGIGRSSQVTGGNIVKFPLTISIGSIISIGDLLYFSLPPYTTPVLAGRVTAITVDLPNNINQLTINTSIPGTVPIPIQDAFFLYIKNSVAESHGVLGHYCIFNITNSSTSKVELFVVQTEVMKSFP